MFEDWKRVLFKEIEKIDLYGKVPTNLHGNDV